MYINNCLYLFIISGKLVCRVETYKKLFIKSLCQDALIKYVFPMYYVFIFFLTNQLKVDFDHLFQRFESPFSLFPLQLQHLKNP